MNLLRWLVGYSAGSRGRVGLPIFVCGVLLFASVVRPQEAQPQAAQPLATTGPVDFGAVNLEIDALQSLNDLQATPEQLKALKQLATNTAGQLSSVAPDPAATQPSLGAALLELRQALASGDEDAISSAQDKVDALDREGDDSGPDIDWSENAKVKAAEALKLFNSVQIANYIRENGDDIADPTEVIQDAIVSSRGMTDTDFAALRQDVSDQVVLLVMGPHSRAANPVGKKVVALLNKAKRLSDDEFTAQLPTLTQSAREITATVDSVDVLRHWMMGEMADLLSNPQLNAALSDAERSRAAAAAATTRKGSAS